MYHQFTRAEAENILRSSEGAPTSHRGTGSPGHAGACHLLLSNTELLARYQQMSEQVVWQNGRRRRREYTLTAELVLNAAQTQAALADFFHGTPRGPGMRAEIAYTSGTTFRMRYAQGGEAVRVMPVHDLVMVLDRVEARPFSLQVQTFFGTLQDIPRNTATITMPGGSPYRSHFVPV